MGAVRQQEGEEEWLRCGGLAVAPGPYSVGPDVVLSLGGRWTWTLSDHGWALRAQSYPLMQGDWRWEP